MDPANPIPEMLGVVYPRLVSGGETTRAEAEAFTRDDIDVYDLMYIAHRVRLHFKGKRVEFCSIVNARAGACSEDCAFCSQSAHFKTDSPEYGLMSPEKIAGAARDAERNGARCFGFVTSGLGVGPCELEHATETLDTMAKESGIRRGGSLGTVSAEYAERLRDAGMEMVNHNLETSERFFPEICKTHDYAERVETLKNVKAAGMQLCSGGIFGMGETWADRLDLLFTLREIGVDSLPLNFLNPIAGTPLGHLAPIHPMEALRCIAIARLVHPRADIRVCGGRETNLRDVQSWMFFAGANAAMLGNYLTTHGRPPEEDRRMISDLGLELDAPAPAAASAGQAD